MEDQTEVEESKPLWTPPHPVRAFAERHLEWFVIIGISAIALFVASRM